jgi:hypothetical protein
MARTAELNLAQTPSAGGPGRGNSGEEHISVFFAAQGVGKKSPSRSFGEALSLIEIQIFEIGVRNLCGIFRGKS